MAVTRRWLIDQSNRADGYSYEHVEGYLLEHGAEESGGVDRQIGNEKTMVGTMAEQSGGLPKRARSRRRVSFCSDIGDLSRTTGGGPSQTARKTGIRHLITLYYRAHSGTDEMLCRSVSLH